MLAEAAPVMGGRRSIADARHQPTAA